MERMTKTIDWVKLPVNLMDDARVAELMARKGMAGLGVYLWIIILMYRRSKHSLTASQVKAIKVPGATAKTIKQVLEEFDLFHKDRFGHLYSVIDFFRPGEGNNDVYLDCPKDDFEQSDSHAICTRLQRPLLPTPARINRDTDTDILLEVGAEAAQAEKRAEECIRQLPLQSAWAEVTLMKSGFGELLLRNWPIALEEFCKHVLVNRTAESILDVECAKQYFYRYATNPASGRLLRQALEEHERLRQTEGCYRYEDTGSAPGHRSYHGIPLPDDAPPRPDNLSDWDFENRCWVS